MNQLGHVRRVALFVLLLLVAAAPAWAEYCKSQGSPRIPKSEIGTTPQGPNVNQGTWARLEDWVRAWAKLSGWVHVISGSVFDDDDDQQPDDPANTQLSQGSSGVGVPSHYYKIIIRETTPGQVEAITLLIPNAANVAARGG